MGKALEVLLHQKGVPAEQPNQEGIELLYTTTPSSTTTSPSESVAGVKTGDIVACYVENRSSEYFHYLYKIATFELSPNGYQEELADYYSKVIDSDGWMLNPMLFQWLDKIWSPHNTDRFASPRNAQLDRFISRFYTSGAEAIDAFICSWTEDNNNWWVPLVHLVPRIVRHVQITKSQGTLVIPKWLSPPF